MKIGITCPVYVSCSDHKRYLDMMTASIKTSHQWIFIPVENCIAPSFVKDFEYHFPQGQVETHRLTGRQPQSVAKAWNDGLAKAVELNCDYILAVNDDIILKSNAIDRVVEFAESHPEAIMWTMSDGTRGWGQTEYEAEDENFSEHPCFSAFLVKNDFNNHFGLFDENYVPAYMEDCDSHARMALANQKAYIYGGAKFHHFASQAIKNDDNLRTQVSLHGNRNDRYFRAKWGHSLVNDVEIMREVYFKHPFNDESKKISFWEANYWDSHE